MISNQTIVICLLFTTIMLLDIIHCHISCTKSDLPEHIIKYYRKAKKRKIILLSSYWVIVAITFVYLFVKTK